LHVEIKERIIFAYVYEMYAKYMRKNVTFINAIKKFSKLAVVY